MHANLEARLVDLLGQRFQFLGSHHPDTIITVSPFVRLGQPGGPARDRAVGQHLDSADPQHRVPKFATDAGADQGIQVCVPHQSVHAKGQVAIGIALLVRHQIPVTHNRIVNARQPSRVEHPTDPNQACTAVRLGHRRNQGREGPHRALRGNPRQFTRPGIALEFPAGWVRRVAIQPCHIERP